MIEPGVVAGVWGAVAASTLACSLDPAGGPLRGYDPVPARMEPRPFLDAWVCLATRPADRARALELNLAYGGLTKEDELGLAVFWGLTRAGSPAVAARLAGEMGLVAALVAAVPGRVEEAVDDSGAGPEHLAAKVALRLSEAGPDGNLLHRAATVLAGAEGLPFGAAMRFALERRLREPEALAAVGARSAMCSGMPREWSEPLGEAFVAGWGLRLDPPATIAELADLLLSSARAPAVR